MPIDNCHLSIEEIVSKKLPAYFKQLNTSIEHPLPAESFGKPGKGRVKLSKEFAPNGVDFSGCYIYLDGKRPIYVGISKNVIKRVRDHVVARNHYQSSLVHLIAKKDSDIKNYKNDVKHERYVEAFLNARLKLSKWHVTFIEIPCPVELYLFEVYAALKLDTAEFNTFKTH